MKFKVCILLLIVVPLALQGGFAARIMPALHSLKAKLPSLYWYQTGIKTGLKFGALLGITAAPGIKLYPQKKSLSQRYALVKKEAQEQTHLLKEHTIQLAGKVHSCFNTMYNDHYKDRHMIICAPK